MYDLSTVLRILKKKIKKCLDLEKVQSVRVESFRIYMRF